MYKLRVYIFTSIDFEFNIKSLMSLKIWSNLGAPKEISKSAYVGRFLVNHTESNFYKEIPFKVNLCFHKKNVIFPNLLFWLHASEAGFACE